MSHTGTVKWFHNRKGWGFIEPDDPLITEDGSDVFVHYKHILDEKKYKVLTAGQRVDFNVQETDKGPMATEVMLI